MTLFELQAWLGHRSPQSTQFYAKISPVTLTRAYDDAGYFSRNVRTIEVLVDRDAIASGAAAAGEPWQHRKSREEEANGVGTCRPAGISGRPGRRPGDRRAAAGHRGEEGPEPSVLRCGCPAVRASLPVVDDDVAPAPTAFLSHASEDKAGFAEPLGRELATLGIRPWLDKWEIRPGDSLVGKLFDEGVAAVDAVIVVVSRYSAGKPWVRAELDAAMVRRITENTRLIPVRLDGAEMPAPLQMLVWHDAARTEEGIRRAARLIADTLHDRDPRPAVATPPAYTSAARVPGLTAADSALLTLLAEEAISANTLLYVPWPAVVTGAASQGLDEALASESLAVLEQRRYANADPLPAVPSSE